MKKLIIYYNMEFEIHLSKIKLEVNINEALRRYKGTNILETKKRIESLDEVFKMNKLIINDTNDQTYKFLTLLKSHGIVSYTEIDKVAENNILLEKDRIKKIKEANDWYLSLNDKHKEMVSILINEYNKKERC